MSQLDRYPSQVFWSDEDDGYIALAIDLPGCSAFGESREKALEELLHAMRAWIDAAKAVGNPIPAPSQPAKKPEYSGRILVRMPKELHANLAADAANEGVSLNQYIVYALTKSQASDVKIDKFMPIYVWNSFTQVSCGSGLSTLHGASSKSIAHSSKFLASNLVIDNLSKERRHG